MRLTQFRRHLDGYSVRVSEKSDIKKLRATKGFEELATVLARDKGSSGPYTLLSTEFFCKPAKVNNIETWKAYVWNIIGYTGRAHNRW